MKIRIIQIGKNKDKYIDDAANEFAKRLRAFVEIEIVTLKERSVSKTFTKERAVEEEGTDVLEKIGFGDPAHNHMNLRDFIVVLDEKGKNFSSVEFSKFLRNQKDVGQNITFVIGGPYGLSNGVKSHANLIFSMSKLTFTHQMVRIILLEQIYRGFCIMAGKEYHNG